MTTAAKNITEHIAPAECATIASELEALAAKNDDASSIKDKARAEAELEDYCYQNLPKIIAGMRLASSTALPPESNSHE